MNLMLHGFLVGAFWPKYGLVVELDGHRGHRTAAQLARDHERDLVVRRHGLTALRCSYERVMKAAAIGCSGPETSAANDLAAAEPRERLLARASRANSYQR